MSVFSISHLIILTVRSALRDRILHAVCGVGVLLIVLVPVFSSFSMRQVQESATSVALSASSLILLVLSAQLGASAIFRDVDRRYTATVLTLPISRTSYLVGRFLGLAVVIIGGTIVLAACSGIVIAYASSTYPSPRAIDWVNIMLSFAAFGMKYVLLLSIATMFSCMSTSFTLPFFSTLVVYLAGLGSQEVFEYISGPSGESMPELFRQVTTLVYYLLPNFSSFDLSVQAIYGVPVDAAGFLMTTLYFVLYATVVVWMASCYFNRRELP